MSTLSPNVQMVKLKIHSAVGTTKPVRGRHYRDIQKEVGSQLSGNAGGNVP